MTTPTAAAPAGPQTPAAPGPLALPRTRRYAGLLQKQVFTGLPRALGFHAGPAWPLLRSRRGLEFFGTFSCGTAGRPVAGLH